MLGWTFSNSFARSWAIFSRSFPPRDWKRISTTPADAGCCCAAGAAEVACVACCDDRGAAVGDAAGEPHAASADPTPTPAVQTRNARRVTHRLDKAISHTSSNSRAGLFVVPASVYEHRGAGPVESRTTRREGNIS